MADQNQEVLTFLKQTQHDFATLIAKVTKCLLIAECLLTQFQDEKTRTWFGRNY